LTPATLQALPELVVEAAVKLGVEDASKLRVDTAWSRPTFIIIFTIVSGHAATPRSAAERGRRNWRGRMAKAQRLVKSVGPR
jgi:hypothetical protein